MQQLATVFSALSDPTRLAIVDMLMDGDMAAGDIAERIGTMSRPAVVKHMGILRGAGIVMTATSGRSRINRLNPEALKVIQQWIDEHSRFWDSRLADLKQAIEENENAK